MQLGFHLWRTQQALKRATDAVLAPMGATARLLGSLELVTANPGLSAAELARRLVITPQSCSSVVGDLERKGWIARATHPGHRAAAALHVTPAGEAALTRGRALVEALDARMTRTLGEKDRAALIALLERAHAGML